MYLPFPILKGASGFETKMGNHRGQTELISKEGGEWENFSCLGRLATQVDCLEDVVRIPPASSDMFLAEETEAAAAGLAQARAAAAGHSLAAEDRSDMVAGVGRDGFRELVRRSSADK